MALPPSFKLCHDFNSRKSSSWNLLNLDTDFPKLFECGFHHTALQFNPQGSATTITDYSVSSPDFDYKLWLKTRRNKMLHFNFNPFLTNGAIHRWFIPRWVTPISWSDLINGKFSYFPYLYKLLAATNIVLLQ